MQKSLKPAAAVALGIAIFLSTGCVFAMTPETSQNIQPPAPTESAPLHFKRHNFQAFCYNTVGCHIIYDRQNFSPVTNDDDPDHVSPPPPEGDYKKNWLGQASIDIPNFPGPAEVKWKSLDGKEHEAKIDIASIFKDELVWHNVPKNDMADFHSGPVAGTPDIFVEVNDKTVNVYITMFIPTKQEQIPGNKYSSFRNDIVLAWTHTY
ncbi:hypothetical protein [Dyella sp.]|uniref:hypothetical protein n=1 Tax=Dyella sp. TaxID=1869338 RepID=UPI002ED56911